MAEHHYDLVVLGSGAAGEKGAAQAAYFGKRVAMVEKDYYLGGATAGTTVPSKTLRETAVTLSGVHARQLHGVDISLHGHVSVQDFLHHERVVKQTERQRVETNMERHKVDIFKGHGQFKDPHTIEVVAPGKEPEVLKADVVLITTGSRPRRPDNFPNDPRIYDSDTILQMKRMPKSMCVVGGGVIGCEYACIFSCLNVDVSLIHGRDILLDFLDRDISFGLRNCMEKLGVNLLMPKRLESVAAEKDGIRMTLQGGETILVEAVMLATGRQSNTDTINLDKAGVELGKYGLIKVNSDYQTNVEHIYAAGDVIGAPALASTGMEQARFAIMKAMKLPNYKNVVAPILPAGIYTIPECSSAGMTEEQCKEKKIPYVTGMAKYSQNARGMIIGDYDGFLKLVYNRDSMKLIGVHVIGEIASELVHLGLAAMTMGATNELFINTCFNYPTLGEMYKYATYDAMGKKAKLEKEAARGDLKE
ncbi:MAG: Si-specific NAD(P)(+) transhydrogenase [Planctomycetota bacterium]|nr:Si-specific NAD(P)(+) transhydrogenase [Planctomycetota bacterium]